MTSLSDLEKLARAATIERNVDEAYNHLAALDLRVGDVIDQGDVDLWQRHVDLVDLLAPIAPERYAPDPRDARITALEQALGEALDNWESAYEDQRTSGQPIENPRIAELRKVMKP